MDRHNNFDLLRLGAALSVIFSHAFLLAENSQAHDPLMLLTGGQTILGVAGVFVFFTISGYLITQSFDTTPSPLVFLAKRALRIFPGLFACLLVCVFVIGPVVTSLPLAEYLTRGETWLFLLHNAVLDIEYNRLPGVLFWPGNIGGIVNGPLWSLPCEVLMYLMLFALGVLRLLTLRTGLALMAVGLAAIWLDTAGDTLGSAAWLLAFFAAGICLYRVRASGVISGRWAVAAGVGLALSIPARQFIPGFAVFGSYLTIYLATSRRLPTVRAARFGDLSYGLYIYGWPIEQVVVYFGGGSLPWWQVFPVSLALAVPTAFLSWHAIERRWRWRGRRSSSTGAPEIVMPAQAAIVGAEPLPPACEARVAMGGISRRYFCGLAAGLAAIPAEFFSNSAAAASSRTVPLGDGTLVPALGQGSAHLGQRRHPVEAEEEAMRAGISLGLTLIDTAESYGAGRAEEMIGRVIAGRRDHLFLVSKVAPSHADPAGMRRACEASLGRLGTDHLDLYLLHWRADIRDLSPAIGAFEELKAAGRIRRWGVSNFGVGDMEDLLRVPAGDRCAINQVEYSLASRHIERDLLPWCARHKLPIMAYSPLGGDGSGLLRNAELAQIAAAKGMPPSAVALAWTMRSGMVVAIPESGSAEHVKQNAAALSLELSQQDLEKLERAFPA